jgi:hypothetical protein
MAMGYEVLRESDCSRLPFNRNALIFVMSITVVADLLLKSGANGRALRRLRS